MITEHFDIKINRDLKRFEFDAKDNTFNSFRVSFTEAKTLDDAKIAVYKALVNKPCKYCGILVDEHYMCNEMSNCITIPL